MKVLFVVPYPAGVAASQRFRVEQWLPVLRQQGIRYKLAPFWNAETWAILYKPGHTLQKAWGLTLGLMRRLLLLLTLPWYDYVFIHREATPLGPPWFEWLAANIFRKKLIYDFDDATWLPNTTAGNQVVAKYKQHGKVSEICRWSYKVSCGNHYLLAFAQQYNTAATYLPTCIDTGNYHNQLKQQHTQRIVIGWTGSHTTLPYLQLIEPVLQRLEQQYDFDFLVIADREPALQLRSLRFILWRQQTEIEDLLQINIGLMPLPDTEWAKGKCAFKALQYMALGIPAVVSAVGANVVVMPDSEAGFTCTTQQEWYARLEQLLLQPTLRAEMGQNGRTWVEAHYSMKAQRGAFLGLFT
ncbi:glycosyltransferase [Pontibacter sp. 172403-2]|uniref:glycosyltransferase n=1 Tax=Pontibacter rufus TaxID=2791028 RepID=UPI0018B007E4|nr:glycosyltransferase [Pontibacter sp. 172403-2]MBF9252056.1 glycosyltransferase [Pontibacter sp. 172403-2]